MRYRSSWEMRHATVLSRASGESLPDRRCVREFGEFLLSSREDFVSLVFTLDREKELRFVG